MPAQIKTLKIPAPLHARLKQACATTPLTAKVGELGAKLIGEGLDFIDAQNARKAKAKKEGAK